jgi:hypothetical protein
MDLVLSAPRCPRTAARSQHGPATAAMAALRNSHDDRPVSLHLYCSLARDDKRSHCPSSLPATATHTSHPTMIVLSVHGNDGTHTHEQDLTPREVKLVRYMSSAFFFSLCLLCRPAPDWDRKCVSNWSVTNRGPRASLRFGSDPRNRARHNRSRRQQIIAHRPRRCHRAVFNNFHRLPPHSISKKHELRRMPNGQPR